MIASQKNMNQQTRRLWQVVVVLLVSLVNFSPWLLYWLSSARFDTEGTVVGDHKITLKARWFPLLRGDSFLGSVFRLEKGTVVFAKARGLLLPQTEFLILGPLRYRLEPSTLAGLEEIRFPWGNGYLYSPPGSDPGKKNLVLAEQGLLATAESVDVLREIESIQAPRTAETPRK